MKKQLIRSLTVIVAGTLLAGCDDTQELAAEKTRHDKYEAEYATEYAPTKALESLTGEVVKIDGNLPGLESSFITGSSKAPVSGETIRVGDPVLIIHVQTKKGLYVIELTSYNHQTGQTVYGLASALEIGMSVQFPIKLHDYGVLEPYLPFSNSRIGILDTNNIELLNR